ncbi:hypothetical protein SteCoe_14824 [Stentor coeruleus]|uniref:Uncharacterized protein n=1 Tax=Stentor coeruleus TaxID=5963 RepID=A0A1R2C539_9CILI|nr:hypothetical protein SteCoe_14824 [Stentor coeruleus]
MYYISKDTTMERLKSPHSPPFYLQSTYYDQDIFRKIKHFIDKKNSHALSASKKSKSQTNQKRKIEVLPVVSQTRLVGKNFLNEAHIKGFKLLPKKLPLRNLRNTTESLLKRKKRILEWKLSPPIRMKNTVEIQTLSDDDSI